MRIKTLTIAAMLVVAAVALVGCSSTPAPTATATPAPAATVAPVATATVAPADTQAPAATATVAPAATEAPVATVPAATAANARAQLSLTAAELAAYNGQNGKPAYVAVNGVIYDVTNVPQWKNGTHQGYTAGKDLTNEIAKAPHGNSVLKDLPVVGKLVK